MTVSRRAVLTGAAAVGVASIAGVTVVAITDPFGPSRPNIADLDLFNHGHPRTFQFRNAESLAYAGRRSYSGWRELFERYDGIVTKAVDEYLVDRGRPREFAARFKREFPKKMVLVHFNGRARSPRYDPAGFFAGSWLYYQGCKGLTDVPNSTKPTTIRVADTSLFKLDISPNDTDNLVITDLTPGDKPLWHRAEQVVLVDKDEAASTITVTRAEFGTEARSFSAGQMYIAAHATSGSTRTNSSLAWLYNFSTRAPKDPSGYNTGDVFAAKFGELFSSDGALSPFDGVTFDVMQGPFGKNRELPIDTDGDGIGDDDQEGITAGIYEMSTKLRAAVGDDRILIADGTTRGHQRNFGTFNGIENEGWPRAHDITMDDWSQGHNLCGYWQAHGAVVPHRFMTFNLRFVDPDGEEVYDPPPNLRRLFFAASQMYDDAAVSGSFDDGPETIGDWDEMVEGIKGVPNWLGMPTGAPQRLAKSAPDLLSGTGADLSATFAEQISGAVTVTREEGWLKITPTTAKGRDSVFWIIGVPTAGPSFTAYANLRSESEYPGTQVSRWLDVSIVDPERGRLQSVGVHTGQAAFNASFFSSGVQGDAVNLRFHLEGAQPVYLSALTAHGSPDAMLRQFENGVVLANPGDEPYTFDLTGVADSYGTLYRIQGTERQDPVVNNGAPVGGSVELAARDGLFLSGDAPDTR